MLIDSTHAEETRVVVLDGNRLEDFDVETAAKAQLKGNIYLAKVVRVEPSLQAAFVEYGGGRHGFLAFGEIHPDYYQIPVADRQRLLEMQEAEARAEEAAEDAAAEAAEAAGEAAPDAGSEPDLASSGFDSDPPLPMEETPEAPAQAAAFVEDALVALDDADGLPPAAHSPVEVLPPDPLPETLEGAPVSAAFDEAVVQAEPNHAAATHDEAPDDEAPQNEMTGHSDQDGHAHESEAEHASEADSVESVGEERESQETDGDEPERDDDSDPDGARERTTEEAGDAAGTERRPSRPPARFMRSYKIQEVIRRRQILLIQVVKEERGTKGAALTTFISLAGRFSVLMPNSPRGGGISRKITSAADRRRLKEVTTELQIPRGMGLIVRTAGAARPKAEIKRDCEYLLELWDSIRETTMASIAPALIHEEANLIKRAIRDNYSRDVEEVLVDGEAGWRAARDFMRMLMPAHARKVILWNEPQPLFARQGVEAQLDGMLQPTVQLKSGGYLVINQTEALVAIDVNSGRSTRERGIEETALKTNLEAADEVARQLRLRDLAGLIVVDFIDMESRRNNALVEKRMKDALRDDRARIQLGSISHFGLMEMSRQRLRPSLTETSFTTCPHCAGSGLVRTTETAALAVLRAVEEEGAKRRAAAIVVHVAGAVALYVLNNKRTRLAEIEARYGMSVSFAADESLLPPQTRIERTRAQTGDALPGPSAMPIAAPTPAEDDSAVEAADEDDAEEDAEDAAEDGTVSERGQELDAASPAGETAEERGRKRRRRRRGGRREEGAAPAPNEDPAAAEQPELPMAAQAVDTDAADEAAPSEAAPDATAEAVEDDGKGRRRGRRGGRRRRREPGEGETAQAGEAAADMNTADEPASFDAAARPVYTGPTPADPFGGQPFDIYAIMDEPDPAPRAPAPTLAAPEPARPEMEAAAAEATAPAMATEPPPVEAPPEAPPVELAPPVAEPALPLPEPTQHVEPAPVEALAPVAPALVEEEPPLLNGHAPPEHAPEPEPTATEPVSAPVPPPVLIGEGEAAATEKKRGWWRR